MSTGASSVEAAAAQHQLVKINKEAWVRTRRRGQACTHSTRERSGPKDASEREMAIGVIRPYDMDECLSSRGSLLSAPELELTGAAIAVSLRVCRCVCIGAGRVGFQLLWLRQ